MLNKPKKPREHKRVGKTPENVQFKNKLIKNINNSSSYETIRGIVEADYIRCSTTSNGKKYFQKILVI